MRHRVFGWDDDVTGPTAQESPFPILSKYNKAVTIKEAGNPVKTFVDLFFFMIILSQVTRLVFAVTL